MEESTIGLINAIEDGKVIVIVVAAITLLINLFRLPALGGVVEKIPVRLRVVIPVVLGALSGVLSNVIGGMSWLDAVFIGLFSGPLAVFSHEAVFKSIFGKSVTKKQLKQMIEMKDALVKELSVLKKVVDKNKKKK